MNDNYESKHNIGSFNKPKITHTIADERLDPRAFCRLRFSPILATGVLLDILREHFGNPNSIVDPSLQQCVWSGDKDTGILIETSTNEALEQVGQRPALLVRRNEIKFERLGINDEIYSSGGQMGRSFVIAFQGSHTIFCISTKPGHAEALVNETALVLLQFSPIIRSTLCFDQDFKIEEIGKLSRLEGSGGQYVVPTTFSYRSTYDWTIDADLPPIRNIDLSVLLG
jgi:hypothetical protein